MRCRGGSPERRGPSSAARVLSARRCSLRMGDGWRTSRRRPGKTKCTCSHFRVRAVGGRSRPAGAQRRPVNVEALKPWSIVRIRYCSSAGRARRGTDARDLVQIGRGMTERGVGIDDSGPDARRCRRARSPAPSPPGAEHRRHAGPARHRDRAGTRGAAARQHRAQFGQRGVADARHDVDHSCSSEGPRRAATSDLNCSRSPSVGSDPRFEQVPDIFERRRAGQLASVVLAVVVEALLAADVADGGLGHCDPGQPGGYIHHRRHGSSMIPLTELVNVDQLSTRLST